MKRREIIVNPDYQRSDKVWPDAAKSYLIESMILGYSVPKFSLYQITDLKSKRTVKEIVDGQQRSKATYDFFEDALVLSGSLETEELRGKRYSELDDELQQKFVAFSLSIDLFVSTTRQEIVEVFRRINSYTVPLNPEEHRHATYQGSFKWFINRISRRFENLFLDFGLFNEKQLVRMADTKFLAEICDALLNGIRTTNKSLLDRLYRDRERDFPDENLLGTRTTEALDQLTEWPDLRGTALMKPYIAYALVLAIIHVRHGVESFLPLFAPQRLERFNNPAALRNLFTLSEALQNPDEPGEYRDFVLACSGKTNVRQQREIRFQWMCRALTSEVI